jgi:hypothetical protein
MQVVLVLLKGLAELSTSLFLETLTELCIISKVSNTSHYFIAR